MTPTPTNTLPLNIELSLRVQVDLLTFDDTLPYTSSRHTRHPGPTSTLLFHLPATAVGLPTNMGKLPVFRARGALRRTHFGVAVLPGVNPRAWALRVAGEKS